MSIKSREDDYYSLNHGKWISELDKNELLAMVKDLLKEDIYVRERNRKERELFV